MYGLPGFHRFLPLLNVVRKIFDNIDKGWPATGVDKSDITIVRILIETLNKIRHDLSAHDRDFYHIVFIRHDVYDMMLDQTSDRGKSGQASIDWTDRAKLAQIIYKRLQVALGDRKSTMLDLWAKFFPPAVEGRPSLEYFIDHSLMRPRFLINLIEAAIANAINRGHSNVQQTDCVDAVRQNSLNLIDDFGFEMRDVSGISSDIIYGLINVKPVEEQTAIISKLASAGLIDDDGLGVIELMLWYGILGVPDDDSIGKFIYDFQYNMKRMKAAAGGLNDTTKYVINPALYVGLTT